MVSVKEFSQTHQAFEGKRFVISGVFHEFTRDGIKNEIEQLGGIIVSSISLKTDYLIAGKSVGPSKKSKAKTLKIKILSEQDFISLKETSKL